MKRLKIALYLSFLLLPRATLPEVTFSSDIPFSKDEFYYLTNLDKEDPITAKDIEYATTQLKRKKRFDSIKIEKNHFTLRAHWMLKDFTIRGIWFDSPRYENLYLLHPGDKFDYSLHEESLGEIKKLLYERGYLGCTINDELVYNKKAKTISVHLTVKKGHYFKIQGLGLYP